jgi:hypothetical protein
LNERDKLILRAFALKVRNHLTDDAFAQFCTIVVRIPVVATLAHMKPMIGAHVAMLHDAEGRPRKVFVYIPLIPRLVALFRHPHTATLMKYHDEYSHTPQTYDDVFDGSVYLDLLGKRVVTDGKELPHTYFSDPRDIAFGLSTDAVLAMRSAALEA